MNITQSTTSIFLAGTLLFTSCASIVSKNKYPVSIKSTPSHANFVIRDSSGNVVSNGKTPSVVTLDSSRGFFKAAHYTVTYSKKGFPARTHQISATLDGWYFGNILVGGLIGMLVVDPATGSMWAMESEQHAHLGDPSTASIVIKSIKTLTAAERQRLIPLS